LSEKGTELEIDITVEDPEYVVEPFTVSAVWVYAPDRRLQRFGCDPENARSFYIR